MSNQVIKNKFAEGYGVSATTLLRLVITNVSDLL